MLKVDLSMPTGLSFQRHDQCHTMLHTQNDNIKTTGLDPSLDKQHCLLHEKVWLGGF